MHRLPKVLVLFLAMRPVTTLMVAAQGTTALTYQGLLKMNGKLATGSFDFIFTLYDGPDPVYDNPISGEVSKEAQEVKDGNFTIKDLDFGPGIFDGREVWLQTCVREVGTAPLVCLDPLHKINPVPYATFASRATLADNSDTLDYLDSTDFLRRTAGCDICIGHADSNGSQPTREQCFDLSTDGRNDGNYLQFSGDVNGNDRLWIWMECP